MCTPVASRSIVTSVSASPAARAWRRAAGACSRAAPACPVDDLVDPAALAVDVRHDRVGPVGDRAAALQVGGDLALAHDRLHAERVIGVDAEAGAPDVGDGLGEAETTHGRSRGLAACRQIAHLRVVADPRRLLLGGADRQVAPMGAASARGGLLGEGAHLFGAPALHELRRPRRSIGSMCGALSRVNASLPPWSSPPCGTRGSRRRSGATRPCPARGQRLARLGERAAGLAQRLRAGARHEAARGRPVAARRL